jgi:predicted metal-dependent hydrolase
VALEAMAYEAPTEDDTHRLLQEAAGFVQQAIAARNDEKHFAESFTRISNNSAGYTRLKTMRAAISPR